MWRDSTQRFFFNLFIFFLQCWCLLIEMMVQRGARHGLQTLFVGTRGPKLSSPRVPKNRVFSSCLTSVCVCVEEVLGGIKIKIMNEWISPDCLQTIQKNNQITSQASKDAEQARMRRRQKYLSCSSDVSLIKIIITSSGRIIASHYSWPTNPLKHNEITSSRANVRTQNRCDDHVISSKQEAMLTNQFQDPPSPPVPTPVPRLATMTTIGDKVTSNRWRPCFGCNTASKGTFG